jgi:hypothetical protein
VETVWVKDCAEQDRCFSALASRIAVIVTAPMMLAGTTGELLQRNMRRTFGEADE